MCKKITVSDDLGRKVTIPFPPKRIISTVPSTTEFLFDLEVGKHLISKTRYCRYPEQEIMRLPNIGGTKDLYLDKIEMLAPDLILANEEENSKEQIEQLSQHFNVYVSKVRSFADALSNIKNTGKITDSEEKAQEIVDQIKEQFQNLNPSKNKRRTLYLIWKNPYMSVNENTFINSMMNCCGFENVKANAENRYPVISPEEITDLDPELVLLASEPFPFAEAHAKEIQKLVPNAKIKLVDGEMFAWYESHLLKAADYFEKLIEEVK